MLPHKLKNIEKAIQINKTNKFVASEIEHGLHFHKGFKMLTEALCIREEKLEWLEVNYKVYKPLIPIKHRLEKITQKVVNQATPPTGRKINIRCKTDAANKLYFAFQKKNELTKRHMRKYRARYWANNQIEDVPQDTDSDDGKIETPEPDLIEPIEDEFSKVLAVAENGEPIDNDLNFG
jgi:hypothetical protein